MPTWRLGDFSHIVFLYIQAYTYRNRGRREFGAAVFAHVVNVCFLRRLFSFTRVEKFVTTTLSPATGGGRDLTTRAFKPADLSRYARSSSGVHGRTVDDRSSRRVPCLNATIKASTGSGTVGLNLTSGGGGGFGAVF